MTISQTLATIRNMGVNARWIAATGEYRVCLPSHGEAAAYYTDNAQDAVGTARHMIVAVNQGKE